MRTRRAKYRVVTKTSRTTPDRRISTNTVVWEPYVLQRKDNEDTFTREITRMVTSCARNSQQRAFCGAVKTHCQHRGVLAIDVAYVKKHMIPDTDVILALKNQHGWRTGGIALGRLKKDHLGSKYFYVHLLCSAERKGAAVLRMCEKYAVEKGAKYVALRAATVRLMKYYRNHRFLQRSVGCGGKESTASRAVDRQRMKELNADTMEHGFWMTKCVV